MNMSEEIEGLAGGVETPGPKKFESKKFSSGHDNLNNSEAFKEERERQIRCAIEGCIGAKFTLTDSRHNFREVSIGGKVVTTKGEGWYI